MGRHSLHHTHTLLAAASFFRITIYPSSCLHASEFQMFNLRAHVSMPSCGNQFQIFTFMPCLCRGFDFPSSCLEALMWQLQIFIFTPSCGRLIFRAHVSTPSCGTGFKSLHSGCHVAACLKVLISDLRARRHHAVA